MQRSSSHISGVVVAVVALGVLVTGCSSGPGHQASASTSSPAAAAPATSRPPTVRPGPAGSASTATNRADLASLKDQLDAAGASLGAADSALGQTDPNQTKNAEGTMP